MLSAIRRAPSTSASSSAGSGGRRGRLRERLPHLGLGLRRGRRRLVGLARLAGHRRPVQLDHLDLEQREVGVDPVGARAQRLDQRPELGLHRLDALEHLRGGLGDAADVALGALDGVGARALGVARRLVAQLLGLAVGRLLDRLGARLGRLDDPAHLLGGRLGQRLAAASLGLAVQRLHLVGQPGQVGVDRGGVVAAPPDGEVALLDGLAVQGHAGLLRGSGWSVGQPIGHPGPESARRTAGAGLWWPWPCSPTSPSSTAPSRAATPASTGASWSR
jgi:hypothetical protein